MTPCCRPHPTLYFDQSARALRHVAGPQATRLSLEDVYRFDPAPAAIQPEAQRQHVLGRAGQHLDRAHAHRGAGRIHDVSARRGACRSRVVRAGAHRLAEFRTTRAGAARALRTLGIDYARETPARCREPRRRVPSHDLEHCARGLSCCRSKTMRRCRANAPCSSSTSRTRAGSGEARICRRSKAISRDGRARCRSTSRSARTPRRFRCRSRRHRPANSRSASMTATAKVVASAVARAGRGRTRPHAIAARRSASTEGQHDLCFASRRARIDPIWAIDSVELIGF